SITWGRTPHYQVRRHTGAASGFDKNHPLAVGYGECSEPTPTTATPAKGAVMSEPTEATETPPAPGVREPRPGFIPPEMLRPLVQEITSQLNEPNHILIRKIVIVVG